MSFTCDPSSDIGKVRWLSGDTSEAGPIVPDEFISVELGLASSVIYAAANVCDAIAALFSGQADKRVGPLSISASQKAAAYAERAKALRARSARDGGTVSSADHSRGIFNVRSFEETPWNRTSST